MQQKLLRSAHYIELGGYQYWPVLLPRGIRLYTYEQIPVFLRDNPYITDGYRAYLPSRLCLRRYGCPRGRAGASEPRSAPPCLPAASSSSPTRASTSGATCWASCSSSRWVSAT